MALPLTGVGGQITVGSSVIGNIGSWDLTKKVSSEKTTPFQAAGAAEINTPILKSWQVVVKGWADETGGANQSTLMNGVGNTFTLILQTSTTPHQWTATSCALMSEIKETTDASKVSALQITFINQGDIVWS